MTTYRELAGVASSRDPAGVDAWLAQLTEQLCPQCGAQMHRWEQLNRRCDRCRERELQAAATAQEGAAARRVIGIPERFLTLAAGAPPWALAEYGEEIDTWRDDPRECLLLLGSNGTGKTTIGTSLLLEQAERNGSWCVWIDAAFAEAALVDELGDDTRPLWRRLVACDVLHLDDLHQLAGVTDGGAKRWGGEQIDLLLSHRYNHRRGLIVTTNHPTVEALYAGNSRLGSRLASGVKIVLTGPDRRLV